MDGGLTYDGALVQGTFLRRYKRFFADVELDDGTVVVAHCANTGSMKGVKRAGARCRISPSDNPKRKLKWNLEQIEADGTWVMIHTAKPNAIVAAGIEAGRIPGLDGYAHLLTERPYGEQRSRIDLLLLDGVDEPALLRKRAWKGREPELAARACYVEVKNVTLVEDRVARFPDAVSARGAKHLEELAHVVALGHRAAMVFHVARADADRFEAAADIDPHYAETLDRARAAGVEVFAYTTEVTPTGVRVDRAIPVG